jgi:hypothetical protein
VHEGGRQWLVECLGDESKSLPLRIADLVSDDEGRTKRILGRIDWVAGPTENAAITSRHLKGEALELLACYLPMVRGECEMQDYLNGSPEDPQHVSTTVEKVIMSNAPVGSPFRLPEEGYFTELLGAAGDPKKQALAYALESYCLRDRAFDVIVVLKEAGGEQRGEQEQQPRKQQIPFSGDAVQSQGETKRDRQDCGVRGPPGEAGGAGEGRRKPGAVGLGVDVLRRESVGVHGRLCDT